MVFKCIQELRQKAALYEETGIVPVFDYSMAVLKSDKLITESLRQELIAAVKPLEDVPDHLKDWHPGSDNKVLDLVHPSICPLVYGKTHVLTDRRVGLEDCLNTCGAGEKLPSPTQTLSPRTLKTWYEQDALFLSTRFQWLPTDVTIDEDGKAKIDSYINNVHPVEQRALYPVIEQFIQKSLPAWDVVYKWNDDFDFQRLKTDRAGPHCGTPDVCKELYECRPHNRPLNDDEAPRDEDEAWEDNYDVSERGVRDWDWFNATHPADLPDIVLESSDNKPKAEESKEEEDDKKSTPTPFVDIKADDVLSSGFFDGASRIQVIVKLANIHLTPEQPDYPGGSWHVEGQMNEHICATALYYYSSDNITESRLAFRTKANVEDMVTELAYEQNDNASIDRTFAISSDGDTLQDIGSILTRQDRAIFFPNVFMHQVQPFRLEDPTRPGHRKILALFLVDPAIPIISTANAPPQQKDWWPGDAVIRNSGRLPGELAKMVVDNIDFLIDEAEAKRIRKDLMEERSVLQRDGVSSIKNIYWNFCEH